MIKAVLLYTSCGDWEGLYYDNNLIEEGDPIGEGNLIRWWLDFGYKYGVSGNDLITGYLIEEDDEMVQSNGNMPQSIFDFKGDY